eukprot:TRINITY_DN7121_c0_g1_i6.p1 TRINITY_DN7121_c0_g1~~TRINITY_DN7121_c0_g1_i6.p1  ORF type:complete len:293 (-),score=61.47 TRINITY_DN7121_c0_g1_i6:138-1016(-)
MESRCRAFQKEAALEKPTGEPSRELSKILKHPEKSKFLLRFCEEKLCPEIFHCWKAIDKFELIRFGGKHLKSEATSIISQYFSSSANCEVNICPEVRQKLVASASSLTKMKSTDFPRTLFTEAKKELFLIMLHDIWPKFIESQYFPDSANSGSKFLPYLKKMKNYSEENYLIEKRDKGWPDVFILTSHILSKEPNSLKLLKKYLKSYPDEVNQQNAQGATALHAAIFYGNEQCIKLLLKIGADPLVANSFGDNPIILAKKMGKGGLVDLMQSEGSPKTSRNHKRLITSKKFK